MLRRFGGKLSALLLASVLLATAGFGSAAFADSGNLGGKPANPDPKNPRTSTIFIKTVEPGASASDNVEVINNTTEEKLVQIYAVDSVRSSGGAFACAQAADPIEDAGSWVVMETEEIKLVAGQKSVVRFDINVPESTGPGEHNACIVLQEKADNSTQSGIGLNFRTAIRVAILVPGDIVKKIVPSSIEAQTKSKEVSVTARVKSESNVSLDTKVKVTLKSLFYGEGESKESTFPVLRDEEAEWNFDFKRPFWGGFYRAGFTASYNSDTSLGLGESGGEGLSEVVGPTKVVFVWPQPAALAVEAAILLLLLFILILIPKKIMGRRRIKKRWIDRKVRAGETITEIAAEVGVRWKKLAKVNKIKAPYNLVIGSVIRVPAGKSSGLIEEEKEVAVEEDVESSEEVLELEKVKNAKETKAPLPGADEPNILKEPDSTESVDDIFEEDDIPQEEIAKEVARAKKIKVKKKTPKKK